MISKNFLAGDDAENVPGPIDSRDGSTQSSGWDEACQADDLLHGDVSDPPRKWKSIRLEPKVSQFLETMEDAVVAHDCGVIIGFNQRVPALLGWPGEKILWRRLSRFIEPVSLATLTRWIKSADRYTILVNGLRPSGDCLLLRLEAVASLVYPGGRRVEVVALIEFAPAARSPWSRNSN